MGALFVYFVRFFLLVFPFGFSGVGGDGVVCFFFLPKASTKVNEVYPSGYEIF